MLRGGVIGFGRMGLTHFSILNNHPEVKFVAVCDSSSFMLKNVSRYLGVETFTDFRRMIDESSLDFVIVATPTGMHADIVKYAVQNNLHVFVEKPFVLNCQQGEEIVAMLNGRKLVNQVGYVNRFHEVFVKVKEHLDTGLVGDLYHFRCEMYGPIVLKASKSSWRSKKSQGGGCLHDFASHGIDLVNYFVGPPTKVTGSVLQKVYSGDVADMVCSTFIYEAGFSGILLANWSDASYRKSLNRIELLGTRGKIVADLHAYKVFLKNTDGVDGFDKGWNVRYITDFAQPVRFDVRGAEFTRQLDYFIECIMSKRIENRSSFGEALVADRIIESIFKDSGAGGV